MMVNRKGVRWSLTLFGGVALFATVLLVAASCTSDPPVPGLPVIAFLGGPQFQGNAPTGSIFEIAVKVSSFVAVDGADADAGDGGVDGAASDDASTDADAGEAGDDDDADVTSGPPPDLGILGVAVAFSVQSSAVLVSPSSVVTDVHGIATAFVLVPYDTTGVVVASGGGATVIGEVVGNAQVSLSLGVPTSIVVDGGFSDPDAGPVTGTQGTPFSLQATATANGDSGVPGLPIAFTLVSASGGMASSTTTVTTNEAGVAVADLLAPYDTAAVVVASGGGATSATASFFGNETATISVTQSTFDSGGSDDGGGPDASSAAEDGGPAADGGSVNEPSGTVIGVVATVSAPGGANAVGVPITFTVAGATGAMLLGSASISSDANGRARASVLVPYGAQVSVIASGAGGIGSTVLTNDTIHLVMGGTDGGVASACSPVANTPTGSVCAVSATAIANNQWIPGLPLAFNLVGASGSGATAVTDSHGSCTADLAIPYGTEGTVVVAVAGTSVFDNTPIVNGPVTLTLDVVDAAPVNEGTGSVYQLIVGATQNDSGVVGLPVSLSLSSGGSLIGTASFATGLDGAVTENVLVPYGAIVSIVAVGGGATNNTSISNGVVLLGVSAADSGTVEGGIFVVVNAVANDAAVPGLGVTFDLVPQPTGSLVVLGTQTTNSLGEAGVAVSVVPDASEVVIEVVGGGSSSTLIHQVAPGE